MILNDNGFPAVLTRMLELMGLVESIIEAVRGAPEDKRAYTLAIQSSVLSCGLQEIYSSGGQFRADREDIAMLRRKLNETQ